MLRLLYSLLVLAAVAGLDTQARSQTSQPQPPAVTTLKANARIVVVDVVVTDNKDNPVHNLKASDFTLLEAGAPQTIKTFEEHSAAESATLGAMAKMPPGFFTNYSPVPPGTINVLLLDALNTPMKDQSFVHDQLLQYVRNAPAGTRIAIFGLNDRLTLLQGLTSDPAVLKAAVEKKTSPSASQKIQDPLAGNGNPDSVHDALVDMSGPDIATLLASIQQFEAQQHSVQIEQRTGQTLDALNALAHYLSGIPGRKNLIWFSASFPLSVLPDGDLSHPFDVVINSEDEFRETINLLAHSQVAVYPIDPRGLMNPAEESAANSGDKYRSVRSVSTKQATLAQQTDAEHGTMDQMAQATGGHAFADTNGLAAAVSKAVEAGSNYYTITYTPSEPKHDASFRKIQVKVSRPAVTLAYRRGYYPDDAQSNSLAASAPIADPAKTMAVAMMRGGPIPTEIILKARVLPSATPSEDALAPGNNISPHLKELKGPFRRYIVDIAADPRAISFLPGGAGKYTGDMEVMTYVYDLNGTLIDTTAKSIRTNLPPEGYKQMFQHGLQFHEEISVPLRGDYYLRIGLHDRNSNRVGAIEIPVAAVKNLAPLPASVPTSNTTSPGAPN